MLNFCSFFARQVSGRGSISARQVSAEARFLLDFCSPRLSAGLVSSSRCKGLGFATALWAWVVCSAWQGWREGGYCLGAGPSKSLPAEDPPETGSFLEKAGSADFPQPRARMRQSFEKPKAAVSSKPAVRQLSGQCLFPVNINPADPCEPPKGLVVKLPGEELAKEKGRSQISPGEARTTKKNENAN